MVTNLEDKVNIEKGVNDVAEKLENVNINQTPNNNVEINNNTVKPEEDETSPLKELINNNQNETVEKQQVSHIESPLKKYLNEKDTQEKQEKPSEKSEKQFEKQLEKESTKKQKSPKKGGNNKHQQSEKSEKELPQQSGHPINSQPQSETQKQLSNQNSKTFNASSSNQENSSNRYNEPEIQSSIMGINNNLLINKNNEEKNNNPMFQDNIFKNFNKSNEEGYETNNLNSGNQSNQINLGNNLNQTNKYNTSMPQNNQFGQPQPHNLTKNFQMGQQQGNLGGFGQNQNSQNSVKNKSSYVTREQQGNFNQGQEGVNQPYPQNYGPYFNPGYLKMLNLATSK